MYKRFQGFVIPIVILLLFSTLPNQIVSEKDNVTDLRPETRIVVGNSYTEHAPFNITCDQDFLDQGWPGDGTPGNPYTVSGLNVTGFNQSIWVYNTTVHFVIENCLLVVNNENWYYGAVVWNSSYATIRGNIFKGNGSSLGLINASYVRVTSNRFENINWRSISAYYVNHTWIDNNAVRGSIWGSGISIGPLNNNLTVRDNVITNVYNNGIDWWGWANDCLLFNNTIIGGPIVEEPYFMFPWVGVEFYFCSGLEVIQNKVSNFSTAFMIMEGTNLLFNENIATQNSEAFRIIAEDSVFTDNTIIRCANGFYFEHSNSCIVESNVITDLSYGFGIGFYNSENCSARQNTIIGEGGGIFIRISNRCVVENNYIEALGWGVYISDTQMQFPGPSGPPVDCIIRDNELINCDFTFQLSSLGGFRHTITGNTINGKELGYFWGLSDEVIDLQNYGKVILAECYNVEVYGGVFSNISSGIEVLHSSYCTIRDVTVTNSTVGVRFYNATNCNLIESHLYANFKYLGWGTYTGWGVEITDSRNCTITANDIHHNAIGMRIGSTSDSLITNNLVYNNTEVGIYVSGSCARNRFYSNQIGWNGVNAECRAASNFWDDGESQGNYWSDYDGEGSHEFETAGRDNFPQLLTEIVHPVDVFTIDYVTLGIIVSVVSAVIVITVLIRRRGVSA